MHVAASVASTRAFSWPGRPIQPPGIRGVVGGEDPAVLDHRRPRIEAAPGRQSFPQVGIRSGFTPRPPPYRSSSRSWLVRTRPWGRGRCGDVDRHAAQALPSAHALDVDPRHFGVSRCHLTDRCLRLTDRCLRPRRARWGPRRARRERVPASPAPSLPGSRPGRRAMARRRASVPRGSRSIQRFPPARRGPPAMSRGS